MNWQPLTVVNPWTGEIIESFANDSSPAWALEDLRDISGNDAGEQKFSYKDARQYFYEALTEPDKAKRDKNWGLTFQTLGQVIHHLQDMAQPQHVRNDAHLDKGSVEIDGTQLNPFYNPSLYELWTLVFPPAESLYSGYPPVYSAEDTGGFTRPRQFWTTTDGPGIGGQGIAEYTNRGFFSAGTLFSSPAFPSPTFSSLVRGPLLDITEVCAEAEAAGRPPCPPGPTGKISFFANTVEDSLRPGATAINPRAASYSLFDQDLEQHGKAPVFALNRFNFDAAHQFLIPRAVAYSAGLINYFFRGRMEISLPEEGVYAIVDHATLSGIDPAAGFKGFDRIKLKLRNATPNSEPMRGGRLVAVMKFRRNLCYRDDLEASYPPQVNEYACRSPREDIVVSGEETGVALTDTAQPFEFSFAQAVPINATDLRLQVVYRGTLGAETDAVAVATLNIAEPTFFSYLNASDYLRIDGKVYTRAEINQSGELLAQVYPSSCVGTGRGAPQLAPGCFNPYPLSLSFAIGSKPTRIEVDKLPPQRFVRIAVLADTPAPR